MTHEPIVKFAEHVLGFIPYLKQAEILDDIYRDGIRTAVLRLGRRSGKGRIASVVATYEATANADAHLAVVPPGENVAVVVIASSQRQARVVHKFIRSYFDRPALADMVVRETADEIELRNGIVILTLPCHAASVRGLAVAVAILDEAAWWVGVDGSPLDPDQVWSSITPAVAQFEAGRILVLSTPRWSTGWYADLVARADSGRYADMRTWHASTAEMNPRIPASFLDQEYEKDPANYRREYLALFESGIGAVFDEADVRRAVRGVQDVPISPVFHYTIALDAAFTGDTFGLLVGHRDQAGDVVVDRVMGWRGSRAEPVPLDPTLDAIAELTRTYHRADVVIDQYSAQPILQGLVARGVAVRQEPWTNESKVDAATETRRVLHAGRLSIPEHRELIAELITLEQRPTPSGRPRIAAPGRSHDDYATACLALVHALSSALTASDEFSMIA